ncbi:MAG: hypothetical protein Q9162_006851 [Coniocarpon cinnabarinum]
MDLDLQLLDVDLTGYKAYVNDVLQPTRQMSGTHDEIIDFALVGTNQDHLAVATNANDIKILSIGSHDNDKTARGEFFGSSVANLTGHEDIVITMDVDSSGQWLVSGAKDNILKLWRLDLESRHFDCVLNFTGHAESVSAVALAKQVFMPDSASSTAHYRRPPDFIISGSQDKTVKHWIILQAGDKLTTRATYTRKAHDKDINAVDIDPTSSIFASASQDKSVKIWSVHEGEVIGVLRGHRRGVWSVKFAPANTPPMTFHGNEINNTRGFVLTGSGDKTIRVWSLVDYSCIRTFEGHTSSVLRVAWLPVCQEYDTASTNDVESQGLSQESSAIARQARPQHALQAASAAGDGLVKIWDIKTGEVAATLDNHTDRVWALLAHSCNDFLISGGGDGVITWWRNTTSTQAAASAAAATARIEEDQHLQNLMRRESYRDAIILAIHLDHPARLLTILDAVTTRRPPEDKSLSGSRAVDEVIVGLSDDQLLSLLRRVRDWNTNAKTVTVSQRILWTILKSIPSNRLVRLSSNRVQENLGVIDALGAYTQRHYNRLEELIDESYLADYTLQEMSAMGVMLSV